MDKTIWIIIGVAFSMTFVGFMVWMIPQQLDRHENSIKITGIQAEIEGDMLTVIWETDQPTDGAVYYAMGGVTSQERHNDYKNLHKIVVQNLNGNVAYHIESCDITGACASSESMNSTFTLKSCTDGTAYGRCSAKKPFFCKEGNLVEDCVKCSCPLGYGCLSDGKCTPANP
jgi:hypothetical protein